MRFFVRFTPFAQSQLAATKTALPDKVGKPITASLLLKTFKNCS